jgi:hypothetical protein
MLNSTEGAHIKNMSIFADECLQALTPSQDGTLLGLNFLMLPRLQLGERRFAAPRVASVAE